MGDSDQHRQYGDQSLSAVNLNGIKMSPATFFGRPHRSQPVIPIQSFFDNLLLPVRM